MKKFFTLVAMALMAVGANAQSVIAEKDWTGGFEGDYPMWYQFADGQEGSVASDAEGVAITVGTQTGELWQPQVTVLNEGLTLEEDGNYKVVVTAKFPSDGTLQINMGNWDGRDQYTTDVKATGDFQEVEVLFEGYAYNVDGNGFVLFQCGDFAGATIVKNVKVINLDGEGNGGEPAAGGAVIASKTWTGGFEGDYPMWYQFADGQEGSVASDAEGVAITVGTQTGELWQPQVTVLNEGLTLEEDGNYKVVVTAKFPSDGTLQINMGNWDGRDQYTTDVTATGDFQDVEVLFEGYAYNVDGNGFVLFQCGDFAGTTIVKEVKVINLDGEGNNGEPTVDPQPEPGPAEPAVIAEKDWVGGFEGDYPMWYQFADGQEGSVASDAEGVAITVGTQTGELWQPQVTVLNEGLTLEEDGNYKVVVTAKFPSDGTLQINMGNWDGRDQYTTDVTATGDFQEVEVLFEGYAYNVDGNGFVLFQCGDFAGTTIVKNVKVINLDGTAIQTVKKTVTDGAIYNLAGQKVNASYKGVVIKNGKKYFQK